MIHLRQVRGPGAVPVGVVEKIYKVRREGGREGGMAAFAALLFILHVVQTNTLCLPLPPSLPPSLLPSLGPGHRRV